MLFEGIYEWASAPFCLSGALLKGKKKKKKKQVTPLSLSPSRYGSEHFPFLTSPVLVLPPWRLLLIPATFAFWRCQVLSTSGRSLVFFFYSHCLHYTFFSLGWFLSQRSLFLFLLIRSQLSGRIISNLEWRQGKAQWRHCMWVVWFSNKKREGLLFPWYLLLAAMLSQWVDGKDDLEN